MGDAVPPNDAPRKDPDPRGPFGDARPGDEKADERARSSLPQAPVEDRPNVGTVKPEDYPAEDRAKSSLDLGKR
ncbi:MAG: hypothetical protein ABW169_00185 [Sphingobium sp.]